MLRLVVSIGFFVLLGLAAMSNSASFTPNPLQVTVLEKFTITTDWQEIAPATPLPVVHRVQLISISIDNVSAWFIDPPNLAFIKPDGSKLKIDLIFVAADGTQYVANQVGVGPGLALSFLPEDSEVVVSPAFPEGTEISTIRIKASEEMATGPILWICKTDH